MKKKEKIYACIDLKSFYASVECVERGLDPFTTLLVVADPDRGAGTLCLAITPAMKALGVRNRCRVFEIPPGISYITARPRMTLYMKKSAEIFSIYQRYIGAEDIHVYSVDECFLDLTDYLSFYQTDAVGLVKKLTGAVFRQTGICATAGIGSNLFLAKVALDILAKQAPDHIGQLDEGSFREKIWHHRPITDIWNVGPGTARRLEKYGVFDLHGVTLLPRETLFREFGVNAEFLIDHALGRESCTIQDIHAYRPATRSLSHSQVLFRDYSKPEAELILKEMIHQTTLELVEAASVTGRIGLSVLYSASEVPAVQITRKLSAPTASEHTLLRVFLSLYRQNVSDSRPIRRVGLVYADLADESMETMDLFSDPGVQLREKTLLRALVGIQNRYGRNAVLKGIDYLPAATARDRNGMVGGHHA